MEAETLGKRARVYQPIFMYVYKNALVLKMHEWNSFEYIGIK